MTEPTYDELMKRLADHEQGAIGAVAALIYLKLGEYITGLEAAEEQEAAALADVYAALQEPRADLAARDKAIADAEGKCVEWSHLLADGTGDDPDERADRKAAARDHYEEWSAEVDRRRARRDEAERGYRDLFEAEERCKRAMRYIQLQKHSVEQQRLKPFLSDLGQATDEYRNLRRRQLGDVLLFGQRGHPEWDQAMAQLRTWCLHAGYRGEDLPDPAQVNAEAMTAAMADASAAVADAPNAVEVMAADMVKLTNDSAPPSRIEGPGYSAPLPRNPPAREWMQLPGRGAR